VGSGPLTVHKSFVIYLRNIRTTGRFIMFSVFSILTRVWQQLEYRINVCLSPVVHTSNISSCQKKTFSVFLWL